MSVALNLLITIAEVVGGLLSGSLALLSDAVHNFGDTTSLAVSYFAQSYGKKEANLRKTFGYKRIEVIAAFFNLIVLALISLVLIKEAAERVIDPQPIRGGLMLVVATVGLLANLATALLLHRDSRHSLNVRSAYLHVISDAASSVGVVLGAVVIIKFNALIVDPLITIAIAVFILYQVYHMLRASADILMNSVPPDVDVERVVRAMEGVELVQDVHHVHIWSLDEQTVALEAHVVIDTESVGDMNRVRAQTKALLAESFGITHSTLELEIGGPDCLLPENCL